MSGAWGISGSPPRFVSSARFFLFFFYSLWRGHARYFFWHFLYSARRFSFGRVLFSLNVPFFFLSRFFIAEPNEEMIQGMTLSFFKHRKSRVFRPKTICEVEWKSLHILSERNTRGNVLTTKRIFLDDVIDREINELQPGPSSSSRNRQIVVSEEE